MHKYFSRRGNPWEPFYIFPSPQQAMAPQAGPTLTLPPVPPPIQQPVGSPSPQGTKPTFLAGAAQVPPGQGQTGNKTLLGQ